MKSADIRRSFLDFFIRHGHVEVPSSPLVPGNDPTLLFTNSGMVQFKEVFLGREKRPYTRAVSSQRCVRAGGKHNDLENVGYTARHHTFFEMLGNFSFGDYFKREAIAYAWEFLTRTIGIPVDRLWVTVYETDDDAYAIWVNEIGVAPERVLRIGDTPGGGSDNFWQMGDTGPCGPCTEIFYDHGPEVAGGPPGSPDEDGDRYIEIWNLVFMQYDRDSSGNLTPLPHPSVDTGMGLERLAAVLQGVHSNYEIDLFQDLIHAAAEIVGTKDRGSASLKVIADHIRSIAFLITDGVMPGNEGRGYVLRRVIRRAARHGHKLGCDEAFLYRLIPALVSAMGEAYPELAEGQENLERVLRKEEMKFLETLEKGVRILEEDLDRLQGSTIPGETIFLLYDTYGFPVDLTGDIARERGLELDLDGFERAMQEQRDRARAASHFTMDTAQAPGMEVATEFTGYERLEDEGRVVALFRDNEPVEAIELGEGGIVVLDRTPFYAESGGQVGDIGTLSGSGIRFEVRDTRKQDAAHLHVGQVRAGRIERGMTLHCSVAGPRREAIRRHHSATHLLHKALRDHLGGHIQQKGSLVDAERLRFDFAHFEPVSADQLQRIEAQVNAEILANVPTDTRLMDIESALASGAVALFGEKYGERVRVLTIGSSTELCGGTHVARTGDIGPFRVVSEGGVAAGVRRIEAVAGSVAQAWVDQQVGTLDRVADLVRGSRGEVVDKVQGLVERNRELEKELAALRSRLASQAGTDLASQAIDLGSLQVLAARVDGVEPKALREMVDQLKQKLGAAAVVLATVTPEGKVSLVAGVTKGQTGLIKAGELVGFVAAQVGGRGGGRPDMAMAGGQEPEKLDAALDSVEGWVRERAGS
ncbi:Alanyl-tRNA synthetase [Thioalkalivibrio nitratireducens DSM 14787]|uniref:Alanine--tRNA ligase n=1 Tax=Thioalkalivibrio nitratireducens (strain DSM 14787 / UNIQEM 213 / ALEN2) TaxID=1255043 RepID=L0DVX0_THIND|nr:alanine--tRNA ligase [Thioalkalivibrio nitratireducens]AGA33125.1 Alanyl-tRNA synthetase [Thioalkalivibrio nitratireducens DSM 14787]